MMHPLSEENLIGADAGIVAFVRGADRQKCRLVVSGTEISGLVSLSDLRRLPVRAALFAMVTQLEMIMANAIRTEFVGSDGWIERMSNGRQSKLRDKVAAAKSDDGYIDRLVLTDFGDKVSIIKTRPDFQWGRNVFKSELAQIESLRNDLAHANNYAATRSAAQRTCERVRMMDTWIERLSVRSPASTEQVQLGPT
jgi:hypothetical protein